jgi:hypothetical protein
VSSDSRGPARGSGAPRSAFPVRARHLLRVRAVWIFPAEPGRRWLTGSARGPDPCGTFPQGFRNWRHPRVAGQYPGLLPVSDRLGGHAEHADLARRIAPRCGPVAMPGDRVAGSAGCGRHREHRRREHRRCKHGRNRDHVTGCWRVREDRPLAQVLGEDQALVLCLSVGWRGQADDGTVSAGRLRPPMGCGRPGTDGKEVAR